MAASTNSPISTNSRNSGSSCESSVTMSIKCKRVYLNVLLVGLLVLFAVTSVALHAEQYHQRDESSMFKRQSIAAIYNSTSKKTRALTNRESELARSEEGSLKDRPGQVASKVSWNKTAFSPQKESGSRNKPKQDTGKKTGHNNKETPSQQERHASPTKKTIEPLISSMAPNATFAACLLLRDDNDILPEWLAYHYHVLRLRHLIVAVDPLSTQSPTNILDRWRNSTDMDIQEWYDSNYMPSDFLVYQKPPEKYQASAEKLGRTLSADDILEINNHRYRQRVFLAKCLRKHREDGNSWTIHIDTDEQITPSKLLRQMNAKYVTIQPMDQPGAVLELIQQVVQKTPDKVNYPCMSMLRVLFGSVESTPEEIYQDVPYGFNPENFESLRWRYHALPHNMTLHGNPKVLLDVSTIPENQFPQDLVFSIHRPVRSYCHRNDELVFTSFRKQPIAVNHYLGSWERYAGRNDKRRSRTKYDAKANVQRGKDDWSHLWLRGFVNWFGFEMARHLLGDSYLLADGDVMVQNDTLSSLHHENKQRQ